METLEDRGLDEVDAAEEHAYIVDWDDQGALDIIRVRAADQVVTDIPAVPTQ